MLLIAKDHQTREGFELCNYMMNTPCLQPGTEHDFEVRSIKSPPFRPELVKETPNVFLCNSCAGTCKRCLQEDENGQTETEDAMDACALFRL